MATLKPFHALRPTPERAASVAAVPYDVVSTAEARALAAGNPLSFLHVSRPEIDLPDGTDPFSEPVYEEAARNFETLRRDAPLVREDAPALYVYRLRMGGREQTGVAGCAAIDEYDGDGIRRHERTRKDKEDDRTRHMRRLGAQTGPVFLTHRDAPEVARLVAEAKRNAPLFDVAAPDGVAHTIWRLPADASARVADAFRGVERFYIADGHHRAASASRARQELRAENPRHTGTEPYNFFLTVAFPAGELRILPYNRVVRDLNGRSPDEFLSELRRHVSVREGAPSSPPNRGTVSLYLAGRWFGLDLSPAEGGGAVASLDAERLQTQVLDPILGIRDVRTDKRIDFVGGIRGTAELEKLVEGGKAAAAFSLHPVSLDELLHISDDNAIMPPKSTWFEPKLRDGLLIHDFA